MLPLLIVVDLLQPSPPIESSLHLMLFPFVQIRHRSMDLADHPGLGPLRTTVRVRGTTTTVIFATVAVRMNATWNDSFLATLLATVEGPIHGNPLLPVIWNLLGSHLRNTRCDSLHGGHLRNTRGDSLQEGHPLQSEWASLLTQGLVHPGDPFLGILALQGHAPPGFPSLQGEVPLLPRDVVMSRETQTLLNSNTHLELRLGRLLQRDPIRGPLLPILLLLREKIEKLMIPLCQHQLRP